MSGDFFSIQPQVLHTTNHKEGVGDLPMRDPMPGGRNSTNRGKIIAYATGGLVFLALLGIGGGLYTLGIKGGFALTAHKISLGVEAVGQLAAKTVAAVKHVIHI